MKSVVITEEMYASLEAVLEEKCRQAQVPGMAIMVSQHGELKFEKYYGFRNVEEQLQVTPNTIFGVASITKSFAALAIMQLVDQGKLTTDDTVKKWLPEFRLSNQAYEDHVTIHHLLTHTSGLPGLQAINHIRAESIHDDPDGTYLFGALPLPIKQAKTVVDLLEIMGEESYSLLGAPGEAFNYSNEGYALLQEIIERASGKSFISFVETYIFEPLHMKNSVFLTTDLNDKADVTELYGYTQEEKKTVIHSPAWWDVGDIYSSGSLKSSVRDVMKYLDVYRLDGIVNGVRIVSEESLEKMTSTQAVTPNVNKYGYGLQIGHQSELEWIGHGGGIKGVSSTMQMVKAYGITVVVLANIAEFAAEDLATTTILHLLGRQDGGVNTRQENGVSKTPLQSYVGVYKSAEGNEVTVTLTSQGLTLMVKNNQLLLRPVDDDQFYLPDGKRVAFIRNELDEVSGIFRGMRFIPKVD